MKRALLAFAATVTAASAARADDTSELQGLLDESVVTTASKQSETADVAPATSTTITAEDLRRHGIRTLAEALDFLSLGVFTSDSLYQIDAGARGVVLAGDHGSHLLLLVDGHAMNEPYLGATLFGRGAGIPLEMVDHIEVILGPGSVLYGSNAMLGVVNVITRRAKDFAGAHAVLETELGRSWRAAAGAGHEFDLFGTKTELTAMVEYYRQIGPSFTFALEPGDEPNSGGIYRPSRGADVNSPWGGVAGNTPRADAPAAIVRLVRGAFDVTLGASTYRRSAPYDDADALALTYFDDATQYQLDRHAWMDAKYGVTLSPIVRVQARLYADSSDYQRWGNTSALADCLHPGSAGCREHTLSFARWGGLELQSSFDWLKDSRLVTLLGVDERIRWIGAQSDISDYDTGAPTRSSNGVLDTQDQVLGAYAQQTWTPVPWLALNAGARIDRDVRFPAQISPRFAATVSPWRGGKIKAIYAEAFRAPSWGETTFSGPNQIVARGLVPETVRSAELVAEQRAGAQKVLFGVFRSTWQNLIELHTLTQDEAALAQRNGEIELTHGHDVVQFRNVASIENFGFNAGVEGALLGGPFRYALNVTGASALESDPIAGQHPVTVAPRLVGNARVSYDLPGRWPTLALASQYMTRRPADRAFDYGFRPDPYAPAQLALRATISGRALFGFSYRVGADWLASDTGPYVVGPVQTTSPSDPRPYVLAPVDTFRAMVTLAYDLSP